MHTSNRSVEHTWNKQGEIIDQCDCRITLLSVEKKKEKKKKGRKRICRTISIFAWNDIRTRMHTVSRITSVLDTGSKKWQGWKQREGQRGGEEQFVNTRKVGRTNIGETISLRFFDIFRPFAFHRMFYFPLLFYFLSLTLCSVSFFSFLLYR